MKQHIQPLQQAFNCHLSIPGSKSITNRALLLAALANGRSVLHGMLDSLDSRIFAENLQQLGLDLTWQKPQQRCEVYGQQGDFPEQQAEVYCQDAGTAARFLLAACAQSPGRYYLHGSPRLEERPLTELITCLRQQGMQTEPADSNGMPLTVIGCHRLPGGEIHISGKNSSQFISALLMVAPLARADVTIHTDDYISRPYVQMTCEMMRSFGVELTTDSKTFHVPGLQHYQARDYFIEPDLSTASYFFAAAALNASTVTISNIQRQTCLQGDIEFLTVLEKMGCHITDLGNSIKVTGPKQLNGVDVDMGDFSDTFMTLACIAPFATSPTIIRNIAHVRGQESDRIAAVADNLHKLQIQCETTPDSITIYPGVPQTTTINSYADHRIAMSFSLIGLRCAGLTVNNAECVAKTCPNYFELLAKLY